MHPSPAAWESIPQPAGLEDHVPAPDGPPRRAPGPAAPPQRAGCPGLGALSTRGPMQEMGAEEVSSPGTAGPPGPQVGNQPPSRDPKEQPEAHRLLSLGRAFSLGGNQRFLDPSHLFPEERGRLGSHPRLLLSGASSLIPAEAAPRVQGCAALWGPAPPGLRGLGNPPPRCVQRGGGAQGRSAGEEAGAHLSPDPSRCARSTAQLLPRARRTPGCWHRELR